MKQMKQQQPVPEGVPYEQELAQEQDYYDSMAMSRMPRSQMFDNSLDVQLKTEDFLNQLKDNWLSREKDKDGEYEKIDDASAVMNKIGAEKIIGFIRTSLHQFNTLSRFEQENINQRMIDISLTITKMLIFNHETWNISKTDIPVLEIQIEHAIQSNSMRAYRGFTSHLINKTIQRLERQDDNTKPVKKFGIF